MIIIVTGTNTDVGKTVATAAIASQLFERGREVVVLKPLQTGEPEGEGDAPRVTQLTGVVAHTMLRYPEPLAPNLSARRAGMEPAVLAEVADWVRGFDGEGRAVLVEGAGGLLVRLADDWTIADLARELDAPLVVVTSTGLGSLNAAELTVEAARNRGVEVLGLVGGLVEDPDDLATQLNIGEFPVVTGAPFWGSIPAGAGRLAPEEFVAAARSVRVPADL